MQCLQTMSRSISIDVCSAVKIAWAMLLPELPFLSSDGSKEEENLKLSSILLQRTICHEGILSVLTCVLAAWSVIDHWEMKVSSLYMLRCCV